MPTPGGKLRAGDRIQHRRDHAIFEVVKRDGEDDGYSVVLRPTWKLTEGDKWLYLIREHHAYGFPADHWRLLTAAWHIRQSGEYEVLTPQRQVDTFGRHEIREELREAYTLLEQSHYHGADPGLHRSYARRRKVLLDKLYERFGGGGDRPE